MHNLKENVDIKKMYSNESAFTKSDFFERYKVSENRTFRYRGRKQCTQFWIERDEASKTQKMVQLFT